MILLLSPIRLCSAVPTTATPASYMPHFHLSTSVCAFESQPTFIHSAFIADKAKLRNQNIHFYLVFEEISVLWCCWCSSGFVSSLFVCSQGPYQRHSWLAQRQKSLKWIQFFAIVSLALMTVMKNSNPKSI